MDAKQKRRSIETDVETIQQGNRRWWTNQPMSYDWKDTIEKDRFSLEWFDEIDRRFIYGARLFAHDRDPFDRILPLERLAGQKSLEIGCGMGLHTELITSAYADHTAIDISATSVEATIRRMMLKQLSARVLQMDARKLEFPDDTFDFVWSWGVIHHSAQTGQVLKEIHRVLKPGGELRFMVYHLDGMSAYTSLIRDYIIGFWRGRTIDDGLWKRSDGFMARHYSKDMLSDILRIFFTQVEAQVFGQDADAVPLPRQFRPFVLRLMKANTVARLASARGSLLFMTAHKPDGSGESRDQPHESFHHR